MTPRPTIARVSDTAPCWWWEVEIGGGWEGEHCATWAGAMRAAHSALRRLAGPPKQKYGWCTNPGCSCTRPEWPCEEWMGTPSMSFCPRCSWNRSGHMAWADNPVPTPSLLAA